MDTCGSETIETPALGQPFNLGMLYDCRADRLVPGLTLWDREELDSNMRVTPKPNCEFEIVASESISDKFQSLGVESSLKASFLGGLVTVEGSAKYLKDNKTLKDQARVTLQYKSTTQFKELTMSHLGTENVKHSYIFEKGIATHVVTAILYGAQAFFVFDREVSDTENLQDIQGKLHVMIEKIPFLAVGGSVKINDQDRERVNQFSCKFHGDFCLEKSPTTFEDAVKVYQDLPKLLGPLGQKAVPVKVWLLPLTTLHCRAARLVRQISLRLVLEAQSILEDFSDLEMRCNNVLRSNIGQHFSHVSKKFKRFMALCTEYKLTLQGTLAKKLPAIRGGGEDEADLADILRRRSESVFNSVRLNQWMDCQEAEFNTLVSLTSLMANTKLVPSENHLTKELSGTKRAVCFVFSSLESTEPYLCMLENCLKGLQFEEPDHREKDSEKWYCSKEVRDAVRRKAKLFSDFAEANKDNKDVRFLAVGLTDDKYKGATIYTYKDGFLDSENFELPSKPDRVSVEEVTDRQVFLSFCAPSEGVDSVTGYTVESCESGQEQWLLQTELESGTVIVSGLTPNTEYCFRVRAVTGAGVGPATHVKGHIQTLPEPEIPRRLAEDLQQICEPLDSSQCPHILQVPLSKDELDITRCTRFLFGQNSEMKNCTIVLLGARGVGKSTLINAMVNYIFDVRWTDTYRFKLVQESQTSEVAVYKINHQEGFRISFSLTVIDSPGTGDSGGNRVNNRVMEHIRTLFSKDSGLQDISAVCLVLQSTASRITSSQRNVLDSALSVFGREVAENIWLMVTFADGLQPPVMKAITETGVPCAQTEDGTPAYYKFNNSALFAPNQTCTDEFDEMFWNMGKASMKRFFDALGQSEPKRLPSTQTLNRKWAFFRRHGSNNNVSDL